MTYNGSQDFFELLGYWKLLTDVISHILPPTPFKKMENYLQCYFYTEESMLHFIHARFPCTSKLTTSIPYVRFEGLLSCLYLEAWWLLFYVVQPDDLQNNALSLHPTNLLRGWSITQQHHVTTS